MDAMKVALGKLHDATKPIDAADRNLILHMIEGAWADADCARNERDRLQADARRYNAFFDAGLPISFCGVDCHSKAELDGVIDAALELREVDAAPTTSAS